jgi:hypothetical protein
MNINKINLDRTVLLSKSISQLRKDLVNLNQINYSSILNNSSQYSHYKLSNSTIKLNTYSNSSITNDYISESESFYNMSSLKINTNLHSLTTSLSNINKYTKLDKYPYLFNFNIKNNLNLANQKR